MGCPPKIIQKLYYIRQHFESFCNCTSSRNLIRGYLDDGLNKILVVKQDFPIGLTNNPGFELLPLFFLGNRRQRKRKKTDLGVRFQWLSFLRQLASQEVDRPLLVCEFLNAGSGEFRWVQYLWVQPPAILMLTAWRERLDSSRARWT
jgi:hypothetical protein